MTSSRWVRTDRKATTTSVTGSKEIGARGSGLGARRTIHDPRFTIHETRGFTLIELIVVALVLGILVVGIAPRMQQTARRLRTEQTAFEMAQSLRYAHAEAVTQARTVRWSWNAQARRVELDLEPDEFGGAEPLRAPTRVPAGITVSLQHDDLPIDTIHFTPEGTSDPATVLVESAPHRYQVTVDAVTSRVDVAVSGT